jgi:DNA-binding CsgD family transcriptional regulator
VAQQTGDRYLLPLATHTLGLVEVHQAHPDRAQTLMEQALDLWRAFGSPTDEGMALFVLSRIAAGATDADLVEHYASQALRLFRETHHPTGEAMALGQLAALARDRGDDGQATRAFQESLVLCAGIDERWSIAQALAGLCEIASRHGQAETAATIIGAIDALGRAVGATTFPSAADSWERALATTQVALGEERFTQLRSVGQTLRLEEAVALAGTISLANATNAPRDSPADLAGPRALTPREREVLQLLVVGQTDREIAEGLFIGHRTVQDHVSHILGKLGVVNRTEATAVAIRNGLI